MIKNFIDKLLGKTARAPADAARDEGAAPVGQRVEVEKSGHGIDASRVEERAVKVVRTLTDAGYEAYIVGGAVRDLLLGLKPKDFDVATNATPEQVKALFRRAFIIGRRFRIVHVVFGRGRQERGLSEVIEVSTFRALMPAAEAALPDAAPAPAPAPAPAAKDGKTGHVVDAEGRVLRDNVWGPQIDDAARRDFTVNAMYYDPQREIVVDYHGGLADARKKLLRMIGDPETRYREDPVRIVRAIRFAAKLGFEIEPKTRAPIKTMAALLDNVPASRMFDEMIKLLQTGHALASLEQLRKQGLHRGTFPILDVALDEAHRHDGHQKFVQLALADTDRRVDEGKPVAPSFMLACLLWHDVLAEWEKLKARGEPGFAALQAAVEAVFDARIGDISGRGKLAGDMREIWLMQPRFERRVGNAPFTLVEQPRFRAGFDFLRLRATVGEADAALGTWWEEFSLADEARRHELMEAVRAAEPAKRRPPAKPARAVAAAAPAEGEPHAASDADAEEAAGEEPGPPSADPARKRRRRRRKPTTAATVAGPAADAGEGAGNAAVTATEPPARRPADASPKGTTPRATDPDRAD